MHAQVCQTLDPLPDKRYIFMKLTYTNDTPAEYEPAGFRAYNDSDLDHFPQRPFMMCAAPVMGLQLSCIVLYMTALKLSCMHTIWLHAWCMQVHLMQHEVPCMPCLSHQYPSFN